MKTKVIDLRELPSGTKLVWDCPNGVNGPVYYPCIKTQNHPTIKELGALIRFSPSFAQYISSSPYLRLPTDEELKSLDYGKVMRD